MKHLITAAAVVAALLTVLSTRLLIPAFILVYRYIEQSFAPEEPVTMALPMSTAPVAVVSEPIEQRQAQSANQRFPSLVTWIAEIHCSTTLLLLGD